MAPRALRVGCDLGHTHVGQTAELAQTETSSIVTQKTLRLDRSVNSTRSQPPLHFRYKRAFLVTNNSLILANPSDRRPHCYHHPLPLYSEHSSFYLSITPVTASFPCICCRCNSQEYSQFLLAQQQSVGLSLPYITLCGCPHPDKPCGPTLFLDFATSVEYMSVAGFFLSFCFGKLVQTKQIIEKRNGTTIP